MTRHERLWGLPLSIPFSKSPEKPDGNEKGTGEGGYLSSFFFNVYGALPPNEALLLAFKPYRPIMKKWTLRKRMKKKRNSLPCTCF